MDDEFEYDYEDDKSYASIPEQTQTYSAPAAAVSPEMAEAMEKFNLTQEEIQGYLTKVGVSSNSRNGSKTNEWA